MSVDIERRDHSSDHLAAKVITELTGSALRSWWMVLAGQATSKPLSRPWLALVVAVAVSLGALSYIAADSSATSIKLILLACVATTLILLLFWKFEREYRTLHKSEEHFRSLVQNTADVILVLGRDGSIRYASPSMERVLGNNSEAAAGTFLADYLLPADVPRAQWLLDQAVKVPGETVVAELRTRQASGDVLYLEALCNSQIENSSIDGILLICRDITKRKALEEQLIYQAYHDPLTDLPNRTLFMKRLSGALDDANRGYPVAVRSLALLFLDLDDFKVINDSLGHEAGDCVLAMVADRLRACIRAEDTVARLGGDEFIILMEGVRHIKDVLTLARRIQAQMRAPFKLGGHDVVITASIGITLNTSTAHDTGDLLRHADVAMYEAKSRHKGSYTVFDSRMGSEARERLELEIELRRAVERGELKVYYQPIVELESGVVCEVEALVRWDHPARGLVNPQEFISLAEQTDLILPIGKYVLQEACRQVYRWHVLRTSNPPLKLSVNLSARQFQHPALVDDIAQALQVTGLEARHIKLEITESIALNNTDSAFAIFDRLKALGIQLAIDDFGTGYSALSYLKHFPFDVVKLDRSFIDGLGHDPEATAIVQAVIDVARGLHLKVTAEGIENAEQVRQLRTLGCEYGQGFYFARPMSAVALGALLVVSTRSSPDGRTICLSR